MSSFCYSSLLKKPKKEIMLLLQDISYIHPNKNLQFENINLTVTKHNKIALIGNNGVGKSTLLKIIAGILSPATGKIQSAWKHYYIPQNSGQLNHLTVAQALKINEKLIALNAILNGDISEESYTLLQDDWSIEERSTEALQHWHLQDIKWHQKLQSLSGGQQTKVLLAGISIHQPDLILMDEPSNHLDKESRQLLYSYIQSINQPMLIVSHDRILLNQLNTVYELNKNGIRVYGGNYDFYKEQKLIEDNALSQDIQSKEKALKKAKVKERESRERQQKLDSRGKSKKEKSGIAKIMINTLRNQAENSTAKLKTIHANKIDGIFKELKTLRTITPDESQIKFGFDNSKLHQGKTLITATDVNFSYNTQMLWSNNINIQIQSGERIALSGKNGSGKTTFIQLILGNLKPVTGTMHTAINNAVYIDQDYSILHNHLNIFEQARYYNSANLQEHEVKIRLNRFLFKQTDWDKPIEALSGGERMRLMICCLTLQQNAPDILILDEPTNNLDIQNIEILTTAIKEYNGSLIVVSHDELFLKQIKVARTIEL